MYTLGMTGTRAGVSSDILEFVRQFVELNKFEHAIHGGAVGADTQFDLLMKELHVPITVIRPQKCISREYLRRNREIVDASTVMIALTNIFDSDAEPLRSGTFATIRYARKKNKPLVIVYRNGKFKTEGI